jgi:hypothetical protein
LKIFNVARAKGSVARAAALAYTEQVKVPGRQ